MLLSIRKRAVFVRVSAAFLASVSLGAFSQDGEPNFALSFEPCLESIEVPPARDFTAEFGLVLTTSDNPEPGEGAQGWSLSLSADGVRIVHVTTQGTLGAEVSDDPPGLRQGGFERSELAPADARCAGDCEGRGGAVSAVVLSFTEPIRLPTEGPALVGRITVSGVGPDEPAETLPARVFFVDGCAGSG